jgi:hypothetical protein
VALVPELAWVETPVMPGFQSFALVAHQGPAEQVVMLVDDEAEAREIADGMRHAGQQVDIRIYQPPRPGFERPVS